MLPRDIVEAAGIDLGLRAGKRAAELDDLGEGRLRMMDAAGIDVQVLSALGYFVQDLEPAQSVVWSRRLNDRLAATVAGNPDRFRAFASLPMTDPAAAVDELDAQRRGARLPRRDDPRPDARDLPRPSLGAADPGHRRSAGCADLRPPRAAAARRRRTCTTRACRPRSAPACPPRDGDGTRSAACTCCGWSSPGVFEELPELKIIAGHMGEGIPFHLDRIQDMLGPVVTGHSLSVSDTLRRNLYLTTSGYNSDAPLLCALATFGADHILFSVDHPFGEQPEGDRLPAVRAARRRATARRSPMGTPSRCCDSEAPSQPRSTMSIFAGAGRSTVTTHFIDGAVDRSRAAPPSPCTTRSTTNSSPMPPPVAPLKREAAVAAAAAAFPAWANMAPGERQRLFLRAADIVERRTEELVELMAVEGGASRAFSAFQIRLSAAMLRQAAGWGYLPAGDVLRSDTPGRTATVTRKPLGVVAGFTPWNGAFYLAWRTFLLPDGLRQHHRHQAVGAGADVGRSDPRRDPRRRRASRRARSTWSPTRRVTAAEIAEVFFESPAVRCINFTGSDKTARILGARAGEALKRMVLELGGFNPVIVLDDADIEESIKAVTFGAFLHQGQVCMNSRKVYVARSIHDEFVAGLADRVRGAQDRRPDRPRGHHRPADHRRARSSRSTSGCRMPSTAARRWSPAGRPTGGSTRPRSSPTCPPTRSARAGATRPSVRCWSSRRSTTSMRRCAMRRTRRTDSARRS